MLYETWIRRSSDLIRDALEEQKETENHLKTPCELQSLFTRTVWKVRGLTTVRRCYAEGGITARRTAASTRTFQTALVVAPPFWKGFF